MGLCGAPGGQLEEPSEEREFRGCGERGKGRRGKCWREGSVGEGWEERGESDRERGSGGEAFAIVARWRTDVCRSDREIKRNG